MRFEIPFDEKIYRQQRYCFHPLLFPLGSGCGQKQVTQKKGRLQEMQFTYKKMKWKN